MKSDNYTATSIRLITTPRKRDMNKPVKTPDHVALAALAKQMLAHVPIFTLPKQAPKTQKEEKR